ncbi:MAG: hypothetical protein GC136_03090 [Alphaproteobacteria bacterium]|nr:hypothetical protein [Alphaproteobacteria bacterium]
MGPSQHSVHPNISRKFSPAEINSVALIPLIHKLEAYAPGTQELLVAQVNKQRNAMREREARELQDAGAQLAILSMRKSLLQVSQILAFRSPPKNTTPNPCLGLNHNLANLRNCWVEAITGFMTENKLSARVLDFTENEKSLLFLTDVPTPAARALFERRPS